LHSPKSSPAGNSTYKKLAVECSADTFVVNQTLVLRINICGKNRQLLVAAKRYKQGYDDHSNNEKPQADKRQKPTQTSIGLSDRPLPWRLNKDLLAH